MTETMRDAPGVGLAAQQVGDAAPGCASSRSRASCTSWSTPRSCACRASRRTRGLPVDPRVRRVRTRADKARWSPRTATASDQGRPAPDCWRAPSSTSSTTSRASCTSTTSPEGVELIPVSQLHEEEDADGRAARRGDRSDGWTAIRRDRSARSGEPPRRRVVSSWAAAASRSRSSTRSPASRHGRPGRGRHHAAATGGPRTASLDRRRSRAVPRRCGAPGADTRTAARPGDASRRSRRSSRSCWCSPTTGGSCPARSWTCRAHGALNLHPSLLPRHRGATPIPAAILAGDAETGVSLIRMDAGHRHRADRGAASRAAPGRRGRRPSSRRAWPASRPSCWSRRCPAGWTGRSSAVPQPSAGATLTRPLRREDGRLDPTRSAGRAGAPGPRLPAVAGHVPRDGRGAAASSWRRERRPAPRRRQPALGPATSVTHGRRRSALSDRLRARWSCSRSSRPADGGMSAAEWARGGRPLPVAWSSRRQTALRARSALG